MPTDQEIIAKLIEKYGAGNSHPLYPKLDWRYAVCKGATMAGYWEWVLQQLKSEMLRRTKVQEGE